VKYCPVLSKGKGESELFVLYRNKTFANAKSICALFNLLKETNHEITILEMQELMETEVITPSSAAESKFCFIAVKRVTTYLRNSMGQESLNALAICLHNDVNAYILRYHQNVIELFANIWHNEKHFFFFCLEENSAMKNFLPTDEVPHQMQMTTSSSCMKRCPFLTILCIYIRTIFD
jgi:hypothetical protein